MMKYIDADKLIAEIEWNDADMRETRQNLISCCRDWERGEKTTLLPVVAVRARYFLEHLTEPQKPAEWNEEYRKEDLRTRFAFYTYKDEDGVLYLSNVFVEETSRNKGFGTKILQAAEMVAQTIGALTIRLKVKQNTPANDWYRRHGYGYLVFEDGYDWLEKNLEYLKPKQEQPELPSDIDKAAEDSWAEYEYRESPRGLYSTCYVDGFKAGAEWQRERMEDKHGEELLYVCLRTAEREHRSGVRDGKAQAEKELIPLINRLCEAILFEWKDAAELARKTLIQIKAQEE